MVLIDLLVGSTWYRQMHWQIGCYRSKGEDGSRVNHLGQLEDGKKYIDKVCKFNKSRKYFSNAG